MRPKSFDQQQALHAAMLQFWESGYQGSSMQNLVDRMGISRQSIYDTYGNKRELFVLALRCYRREIVAPKVRRLEDSSRDPIEALREHFQGIIDGWHGQIRGCLMVRTMIEIEPGDSDIGQLLGANTSQVRGALHAVIERGQASALIDRSRSAAELAARIMALSAGLHVYCRQPDQNGGLRPLADNLIASFRAS